MKILLALAMLLPMSAIADTIDVYLIGGQSNADGRGVVSELPAPLSGTQPVPAYFNSPDPHALNGTLVDVQPGLTENPTRFGLEIALADVLLPEPGLVGVVALALALAPRRPR